MSANCTDIGYYAFYGCTNLRSDGEFTSHVVNTGDLAYCKCENFTGTYYVPEGDIWKDPIDEPTSALDPTMVGEVQTVIRDLSRSGKTMMIVTHEMRFAREISNRVFYMDDGGIYEDGTPDQIFGSPQKELTRRFIRQLKVLELKIDSHDFDFIGAGSEIDLYCMQNDMMPRQKYHIRLAVEELVQQILLPEYEDPDILVTVEYSPDEQTVTVSADYKGKQFDPMEAENDLALTVLKSISEDIGYTYDEKAEIQNHAVIKLA